MKHITLAAMTLLTISATAQSIVTDTTFFTVENGTLFQTTRTIYENGARYETTVPTDTMRVANITAAKIRGRADELNKAFRTVWNERPIFAQTVKQDSEVRAGIGISPLNLVRESADVFSDTLATWVYELNGNQTPCTFSVTSTGVLRIKIGEQANRTIILLGSVLRVNALPSVGTNEVFYRLSDRFWVNFDGSQRLIRTSLRRLPQTDGF